MDYTALTNNHSASYTHTADQSTFGLSAVFLYILDILFFSSAEGSRDRTTLRCHGGPVLLTHALAPPPPCPYSIYLEPKCGVVAGQLPPLPLLME